MSALAQASAGGINCVSTPTGGTSDSDNDGLSNTQEQQLGTDPTKPDSDGDGLKDGAEVNTFYVNPLDADTDDGGVSDGLEVSNGTNPLTNPGDDNTSSADSDGDGLNNVQEQQAGTYPTNGMEYHGFTMNKRVKTSKKKPAIIGVAHTNPCGADTDGDGIKDGKEVRGKKVHQKVFTRKGTLKLKRLISNPTLADSDGDGLRDKVEVTGSANKRYGHHKTDPLNYDTDRGKINDGREVKLGSDPSNYKSAPERNHQHSNRTG